MPLDVESEAREITYGDGVEDDVLLSASSTDKYTRTESHRDRSDMIQIIGSRLGQKSRNTSRLCSDSITLLSCEFVVSKLSLPLQNKTPMRVRAMSP